MASDGKTTVKPVLILGAGINGCATARELVLNGIPVYLVDNGDVARGATAKSSRLIHGGLRYLEYGEFDLVRESLAERTRLFRLAPQFVQPLRFFIPVRGRLGGLWTSIVRFLGLSEGVNKERGQWLVRIGLWMYDRYARDPSVPDHSIHSSQGPDVPAVDAAKYPWVCSYTDGQMLYPERFVLSMIEDTYQIARESGVHFELRTYHQVKRQGTTFALTSPDRPNDPPEILEPAAVINATGAWGDFTLAQLGIPSRKLFGGTKGSHFLTHNARFREMLHGKAIYAEADDGRLVFVLPVGPAVFVGTTDEPFEGPPDQAIASEHELEYLIHMVNTVVPGARLGRSDISMHYCGVRPLPAVDAAAPTAVTRRHWIEETEVDGLPLLTLIGGKLTTCRSLGEQTADRILLRMGLTRSSDTQDRPYPGSENYPPSEAAVRAEWQRIAELYEFPLKQVELTWGLLGTRTEAFLARIPARDREVLPGTDVPVGLMREIIRQEWVHSIEDLIERRIMLIYEPTLRVECLQRLGTLLVEAGKLSADKEDAAVRKAKEHLSRHYGLFQ